MKAFLGIFITLCTWGFSTAQSPQAQEIEGVIDVMGEAEIKLNPDFAEFQITIEKEAADPKAAQQAVMEETRSVLDFLKNKDGIEKTQTQRIELRSRMDNYPKGERTYLARQVISFELKKLEAYDEVILTLLEKGLDGIDNVNFRSSQEEKHRKALLQKAVVDAREKATIMAAELRQSVGKAVYVSDKISQGPSPVGMEMYKTARAASPSIAPGEIILTAVVNIRFQLN